MKNIEIKPVLSALALSATLALTGCASNGGGGNVLGGLDNGQLGAVAGTIAGAAIGNEFGSGSGKDLMRIVGAVVGGVIGAQMGSANQKRIFSTLDNTPNNQTTTWKDQQQTYRVTPVNYYQGTLNGQMTTCRNYKMDVLIDGRMQQINGRACRNAAAQWIAQ